MFGQNNLLFTCFSIFKVMESYKSHGKVMTSYQCPCFWVNPVNKLFGLGTVGVYHSCYHSSARHCDQYGCELYYFCSSQRIVTTLYSNIISRWENIFLIFSQCTSWVDVHFALWFDMLFSTEVQVEWLAPEIAWSEGLTADSHPPLFTGVHWQFPLAFFGGLLLFHSADTLSRYSYCMYSITVCRLLFRSFLLLGDLQMEAGMIS